MISKPHADLAPLWRGFSLLLSRCASHRRVQLPAGFGPSARNLRFSHWGNVSVIRRAAPWPSILVLKIKLTASPRLLACFAPEGTIGEMDCVYSSWVTARADASPTAILRRIDEHLRATDREAGNDGTLAEPAYHAASTRREVRPRRAAHAMRRCRPRRSCRRIAPSEGSQMHRPLYRRGVPIGCNRPESPMMALS